MNHLRYNNEHYSCTLIQDDWLNYVGVSGIELLLSSLWITLIKYCQNIFDLFNLMRTDFFNLV